ncbi:MAG: sigma-70 family RNA polymerase sigma factor [Planctomycetes bacterium]|nr:sigma-70 family RNA polymerase sigma factor [Planctomycetota bacterium]
MAAVDRRAELEKLVRTHQRGVWRYLRYLGAENAEADDITQETFLTVWRNPFDQYDERATAGYLRQVAKNKFLMHLRAKGRRPEVGSLDEAAQLFDEFARDDGGDRQIDAMAECMRKLQGKARRVVDAYYKEGNSRAATATIMQMTEEGVKTLLRRVKESLRECVEKRLK